MKRVILFIISTSLIVTTGNVKGDITWDSGHHVFTEGSETFVNMFNDASAEISGGYIAEFSMYDNTTADITGGQISILWGQGSSSVDVYAGSDISLLRPNDSSTSNVYDGTVDYLFALGYSITNIYGGFFDEIAAEDFSSVNLYVESYDWDPTGGARYGGLITGVWLESNESFNIDLVSEGTINHLNFVPEPTTLFLFGIGGLMLRRRKNEKSNFSIYGVCNRVWQFTNCRYIHLP